MHTFTLIFICLILLNLGIQTWLSFRHIRHIAKHRNTVPEMFAASIPLESHQKAAEYCITKTKFSLWQQVYGALILLSFTLGGALEVLDKGVHQFNLAPIAQGSLYVIATLLILNLLDLPNNLYDIFSIEDRFGFNRSTFKVFLSDLGKEWLLTILIGVPLVWLILWFMQNTGPFWWFYTWVTWFGFNLLMMWAYPKFIAPIFNKFIPLEDSSLRQRIEQLLERNGFASQGIFVMDGSTRSSHGNAYFTGIGTNKRIVFFDTLLKDLNHSEIESVLAHELGHFKCKHITKQLILMGVLSFIALAGLGWLANQHWFYQGLGISTASIHAALVLFLLCTPVFSFLLHPLMTLMSRKFEYEADRFAAEHADVESLYTALVKLYKENASTLTPDPLYSAYHDSHPPAPLRVAHLQSLYTRTT